MNQAPTSLPVLLGGTPAVAGGPPDWPIPDAEVLAALEAAYRSGTWGKYHGDQLPHLEQAIAQFFGVPLVWPCCSGTFAVELALRSIKVGAGDEVILSAYDYPGNFRSVLAVGARPVLVDVDRDNWNLAIAELEVAISSSTRAVIASHLHGGMVPIRQVVEWAHNHGVGVIEDAAQATGAMIDGRRAGAWGDVGTLSFGGSKLLTAGRGGCLLTPSPEIHQRAKLCCERGNNVFPLSELQAAVLIPQLAILDQRNRTRRDRVTQLASVLKPFRCLRPLENAISDAEPAYYKVGFQYDANEAGGMSRELFVNGLQAEGVAIDVGFRAAHIGRSSSRFGRAGDLVESERAHHGMVVLHHPVLLADPTAIEQIAKAVEKVLAYSEELIALSAAR